MSNRVLNTRLKAIHCLTHFSPMFISMLPENVRRSKVFLTFSGCIEIEHRACLKCYVFNVVRMSIYQYHYWHNLRDEDKYLRFNGLCFISLRVTISSDSKHLIGCWVGNFFETFRFVQF